MSLVVPASREDARIMAEIHAVSFPEPWDEDDFVTMLSQPGIMTWIAGETADDEPGGFIMIRRVTEESEVLTIAVDPARRRNGLGHALLKHALDALRERGTASCYLEVAIGNTAAIALYQAHGFKSCATRRGYYRRPGAAPEDAHVMRCDL